MSLSSNKDRLAKAAGPIQSFLVEDNKHLYKGALVVANNAGYAEPATNASGKVLLGVAYEECDNTLSGHTQGGKSVRVIRGGSFPFTTADLVQADVGIKCYIEDDDTVNDAVICCPTGVIGPWDYGISNIGQLILDFASGHLKSYVSGAYDFVDVRDVARGLILAAEKGQTGRHYIFSGAQVQVPELMEELARDIGYPAPTYRIPTAIARTAGVLASIYYRLLRRRPVFTAYSIDVLRSNSLVSSARAREALGFTSRPWKESIRDHVEWFRAEGMLPIRR